MNETKVRQCVCVCASQHMLPLCRSMLMTSTMQVVAAATNEDTLISLLVHGRCSYVTWMESGENKNTGVIIDVNLC